MQSEVARTLNDLQSYSSTREAKVEAGRILQEQRKLEADAAKLQDLLGKDAKDLTDAQRAELDELRDNQKRLEERTQQLLSRMQHTADAPKELERLAAEQESLRQEIKDARGQRELEPLAKKEKDLAERTKAAADEMKRLGAEQAAAALQKAAGAMERDAERLHKGQRPENDDAGEGVAGRPESEGLRRRARELKEALDKAAPGRPRSGRGRLTGRHEAGRRGAGPEPTRRRAEGSGPGGEQVAGHARAVSAQEEEHHEGDLDQLAKKLAEKQKELEKLAQEQDELQEEDQGRQGRKRAGAAGEEAEGIGGQGEGGGRRAEAAGGGARRRGRQAGRRRDGAERRPAGEGAEARGRGPCPGPFAGRSGRGGRRPAGRGGPAASARSRPASPKRCRASRTGRRR